MTYDAKETSVEDAHPVEVYEFTYGATQYFYTSAEDVVTLSAQDYDPVPLTRSDWEHGAEQRDAEFTVDLPTSDPVASLVIAQVPSLRIHLVVKRYHRNDTPTPQVRYIFDGYVHAHSFLDGFEKTRIVAKSALAGFGRENPRRDCAATCGFVLYSLDECKVDSTLSTFRAAAYSVSGQVGAVLTVPGLAAYGDGWFDAGLVEVVGGTDVRDVLSHTGDDLLILIPFATQPSSVNVFAGCDHSIGGPHGCGPKFDNVPQFGGMAFVPKKNPHEGLN